VNTLQGLGPLARELAFLSHPGVLNSYQTIPTPHPPRVTGPLSIPLIGPPSISSVCFYIHTPLSFPNPPRFVFVLFQIWYGKRP